nr:MULTISPECIES: hypothetical protein [Streptomyces]
MAKKVAADDDFFAEQINLARHIAAGHLDEVPPHSADCPLCPKYAELPDDSDVWAQRRARDRFLPEGVARRL